MTGAARPSQEQGEAGGRPAALTPPLTAAAIAAAVGGSVLGDGGATVCGVAPLDRAGPDDLSLFSDRRYAAWFAATRAGVVVLAPELADFPGASGTRVVVAKPAEAMVAVLEAFRAPEARPAGVHATAVVAPSARLGTGVTVEAYAVVGDDVEVGDGTWIGPHVVIQAGSRLGRDVRVHAHAVVYPRVILGDRVVLHAGACVGREGFGFVPREGRALRIPHVGRCVLEDDVEVGAHSCVDRGSVDDTVIGAGTKIDNLVQVGHNVRIGRGCLIASQAGLAGSTRLEAGVRVGGQAGLGGHLTVGAGATVAAQAGVFGDVPAGETWSGYPARPHREQLRVHAAMARLAQLVRPLEQLLGGGGRRP